MWSRSTSTCRAVPKVRCHTTEVSALTPPLPGVSESIDCWRWPSRLVGGTESRRGGTTELVGPDSRIASRRRRCPSSPPRPQVRLRRWAGGWIGDDSRATGWRSVSAASRTDTQRADEATGANTARSTYREIVVNTSRCGSGIEVIENSDARPGRLTPSGSPSSARRSASSRRS